MTTFKKIYLKNVIFRQFFFFQFWQEYFFKNKHIVNKSLSKISSLKYFNRISIENFIFIIDLHKFLLHVFDKYVYLIILYKNSQLIIGHLHFYSSWN